MDSLGTGKDVHVKLALTDTDLSNILRRTPSRFLGNSTPNTKIRKNGKGDVYACYSAREGTLTLTGVFHDRFPFNFHLKPGTKSYGNVIKYLLEELRLLPDTNNANNGNHLQLAGECLEVVDGLKCSLEGRLLEFDPDSVLETNGHDSPLEVFRCDFIRASSAARLPGRKLPRRVSLSPESERRTRSLLKNWQPQKKQFRVFDDKGRIGPQLISGFMNLDIEELPSEAQRKVRKAQTQRALEETVEAVRRSLKFFGMPKVSVREGGYEASVLFKVDSELLPQLELYFHWGSYGNASDSADEPWIDDEVTSDEITEVSPNTYRIRKRLSPESKGRFGLTCCAVVEGTRERVWAGQGMGTDAKFQVTSLIADPEATLMRLAVIEDIDTRGRILQSLATFDQFVRTISQLSKSTSIRGLGRLLFELTKDDLALRSLVSEYYQRIVLELEQRKSGIPKSRLRMAVQVLKNIGIGEVVFVAPEGPHAIAGGLAQVIVGLSKSLSQCGISCTIISPLYEEAQGNKHTSAERLLADGIQLVGKRVPVKRLGEVKIPLGPSRRAGSTEVVEPPKLVRSDVYMAENEGVRIIFLRHRRWASRLYASGWGDDQLRRGAFLSRGALEIMRDQRFNVKPHILVTNDWPSALVPVLLRTDQRYLEDPRFQGVETVHIMHNCGQGYQGRYPVNQFGEDLWPILGIGGEHFFGLTDPDDRCLLNLTAGAALHSGKALVAVSKPYAEQLLTENGGEGLDEVFSKKGNVLFGISNGVDIVALRNLFWKLGETARDELGMVPLIKNRFSHKRLIKNLPSYKRATKSVIQRKYSLKQDPNSVLISFVGRLAEQKGIKLLTESAWGEDVSVLESILRLYPEVQFLVGGPPSVGDSIASDLENELSRLAEHYPGRIRGVFDFIPHRDALEITEASDLFLMPSRYEPGGITQLEALATGTLVVARNVGGIAATLVDYSPERDEGNSFLFREYSSTAFKLVLERALETIKDDAKREMLIMRAALAENDWSHRAPKYLSILQYVAGVFDPRSYYAHLAPRWHLLNSLRASVSLTQ